MNSLVHVFVGQFAYLPPLEFLVERIQDLVIIVVIVGVYEVLFPLSYSLTVTRIHDTLVSVFCSPTTPVTCVFCSSTTVGTCGSCSCMAWRISFSMIRRRLASLFV